METSAIFCKSFPSFESGPPPEIDTVANLKSLKKRSSTCDCKKKKLQSSTRSLRTLFPRLTDMFYWTLPSPTGLDGLRSASVLLRIPHCGPSSTSICSGFWSEPERKRTGFSLSLSLTIMEWMFLLLLVQGLGDAYWRCTACTAGTAGESCGTRPS